MTVTRGGQHPRQALSTLGSNELGVVDALRAGPADEATIAASAGISVSEVGRALQVLAGLELVQPVAAEGSAECFELNKTGLRLFLAEVQASSKPVSFKQG